MGGGQQQLKDKWAVEFKEDETIALIEVGGQKRAEAQAEIGADKAAIPSWRWARDESDDGSRRCSSLNDEVQRG